MFSDPGSLKTLGKGWRMGQSTLLRHLRNKSWALFLHSESSIYIQWHMKADPRRGPENWCYSILRLGFALGRLETVALHSTCGSSAFWQFHNMSYCRISSFLMSHWNTYCIVTGSSFCSSHTCLVCQPQHVEREPHGIDTNLTLSRHTCLFTRCYSPSLPPKLDGLEH